MTVAKPSVVEALSAVMEEVQAVKKDGRNTMQNYSFRGVDQVVNAVGPALRKHGVLVVPTGVMCESEHYTTGKGTPMRGVTLTVSFRFYGPNGDFIDATVCGESADSGDKAVPKAHSVAYRTLLLQALCIPTDEPDPDAQSHERVAEPKAKPKPKPKDEPTSGAPKATASTLAQLRALVQANAKAHNKTTVEIVKALEADLGAPIAELDESAAQQLAAKLARWAENADKAAA